MSAGKGLAQRNPDWDELYTSIEEAFDLSDVRIRILVFGPDLDGDKPGSELRNHIIRQCDNEQFTVVLTEYEEMQELFLKILGPVSDLCKVEYGLALAKDKNTGHDIIDAIIILPHSPGSFIELGMFAIDGRIHRKMLVLFSKEFEPTIADSFVGKGPKMALDNSRPGLTKLMDYQDLDSSWSEVSKFLEFVRSHKKWHTWMRRNQSYG